MTATMEEKQEIIQDLITCAGAGNIKKYHCYLERFSPEYLLDDVGKAKVSKERKYPKIPQMEGEEVVRRAEPCHYTNLHENMSRIFEALSNQTGQFFRKISFKLIQYTKSGERAYVDGGRVCPIIRLNAWTRFRCSSRVREDTVRCLNWKTRTGSWISIVM